MSFYAHSEPEPIPGPPSPARIRAAVARIVRRHAAASDRFAGVFGETLVNEFSRRVGRLAASADESIVQRAECVHALAIAFLHVTEAMELECDDAADLAADLAAIVTECELIAQFDRTVSEELSDDGDADVALIA